MSFHGFVVLTEQLKLNAELVEVTSDLSLLLDFSSPRAYSVTVFPETSQLSHFADIIRTNLENTFSLRLHLLHTLLNLPILCFTTV
jgi:hypothetical protein